MTKCWTKVFLSVCLVINSSCYTAGSNSVEDQSSQYSIGQSQKEKADQAIDPRLQTALQQSGIVRPFAWGTWLRSKDRGAIVGIDQEGKLKTINFAMASDGRYSIAPSEAPHQLNEAIQTSGSLRLTELLPDSEFPFRSNIIRVGDCQVHFVLVWRALNRSFDHAYVLDAIDLRIIVEKNSEVISNKNEEMTFFGVAQAFTDDINKDGRPDFIFLANDNYAHIYLWSVEKECNVTQLSFSEDGKLMRSVPGREILLKRDSSNGGYAIHARLMVPITKKEKDYWQVTESIYKWDLNEKVYNMVERFDRLERAE